MSYLDKDANQGSGSYLDDTFDKAKGLLGRQQSRPKATETDSIRQDSFDKQVFRELLEEAPALSELAYEDLGQKYDYTEELVGDILQEFWQGDPQLRDPKEMYPSFLLNHCVAKDIIAAPETPETRTFTKHDRYGAAMATIAVTDKIKEALEKAREAQEAAEQAAEAEKALQDAMNALLEKLSACGMDMQGGQPGGEQGQGGDEEGDGPGQQGGCQFTSGPIVGQEGPLTEDEDAAVAALVEALQEAQDKELSFEATLEEAREQVAKVERELRAPVRQAVKEVGDKLADEAELFSSWGVEDGYLQRLSFRERQQLASALRNSRIAEFRKLIGRFRTMGEAQRAKKVEFARDEAYDVEMSGRLPDVLASEFALIANKHTRLDFLERLAEDQLLSKKYRGIEKIGQGSIICLVDNSGSMTTRDRTGVTREAFAKAFALSLLDQARAANRDFVGINFSSQNQVSVFRFPKGKGDIVEVMRFIEEFYNGGTDYMAPLDLAMDILDKEFNDAGLMRADLVMVTDDDCRVTPQWQAAYDARKEKLGFRTFGIAVGCHAGNALGALSDNVRSIHEFSDPMAVADIIRTV